MRTPVSPRDGPGETARQKRARLDNRTHSPQQNGRAEQHLRGRSFVPKATRFGSRFGAPSRRFLRLGSAIAYFLHSSLSFVAAQINKLVR